MEEKMPTFGEVYEMFMRKCETKGLEPATLKSYRYLGQGFLLPALGDIAVADLTPTHFDDLALSLKEERKLNPRTVRKANTLAGGVLKLAERNDWVTKNVARLAELPKTGAVKREIPSPEELAHFLSVAKDEDPDIHDYGYVMAGTGTRPGEACALRRDDLEGRCLHIRRAVDVSHCTARIKGTKTGKERRVTLDERTLAIFLARMAPWVFGGEFPARTDLMSKRWKRVACKAGTRFTARSCRHFHATQLLGSGMSPRAVADRLGHSTPVVTLSVYAQSIPQHDEVAAQTIANVLPPTGPCSTDASEGGPSAQRTPPSEGVVPDGAVT